MLSNIHAELTQPAAKKWQDAKTVSECEQVIRKNSEAMNVWMQKNKPVILMCPPQFFSIDKGTDGTNEVAGNAFVNKGYDAYFADQEENYRKMQQDWQEFCRILKQNGAEIITIPPQEGFPDQVFTADHTFSCSIFHYDHGQLTADKSITIFSRLAHPSRGEEMHGIIESVKALRDEKPYQHLFDNRDLSEAQCYFEGIGESLLDPYRGIILSGYGYRNTEMSLHLLQNKTGIPVYGIKCKKPFFHLDTFFAPLPDGHVLYAPDVMHEESRIALEQALFKGHAELKEKYAITVSAEDAYHFACNLLVVGKTIIAQNSSDTLNEALRAKGLKVIHASASVANYAGGSLHCMSNTFNQPVFI